MRSSGKGTQKPSGQQLTSQIISEEYHRLFNETPVPMYIFDSTDYSFLAVNDAALFKYQYSREEFLKLKAVDIRPLKEIDRFYKISNSVPDAYTDAGRFIHVKKSGEEFNVNIFSRTTDFEGRTARLVVAVDIDRKVKTEIALKNAMDDISDILESITDGFYTVNKRMEFTYLNKEFELMLGRGRSEVLGKKLWEVLDNTSDPKNFAVYKKAIDERQSVHFEEFNKLLQIWTMVNACPIRDGLAVYFVDITAKKEVQANLFHEQQNMLAIMNNTDDVIWSVDRELNIVSANQAFWNRVEKITGKRETRIREGDYMPGLVVIWQQYYNRAFKGESFKITWTGTYDNSNAHEEISFHPITDLNGNVSGVSCFSRDVTYSQEHKIMIEEQNLRLKKIAWIQSHKVRAPVATLIGLLQLLDTRKKTFDPYNREIIELISQMAGRFDDVIHEITRLTVDIEAGSQEN